MKIIDTLKYDVYTYVRESDSGALCRAFHDPRTAPAENLNVKEPAIMKYGMQIGQKFHPDGTACRYPGNTVIADIGADSPARTAVLAARQALLDEGLGENYILMPDESYHVTVLRGLNDRVRTPQFWPAALPADVTMEQADRYFVRTVGSVPLPQDIRMRFTRVHADDADLRLCMEPETQRQRERLRRYRDEAADALGLRLPGHDAYTYHATLAYTRVVPQGAAKLALERFCERADALLAAQPPFALTGAYLAFYADMLCFYPSPVGRESTKESQHG